MTSTIDRHIFSEWLKGFIMALAITLGLLLMEDMYDDLSDLLGYGVGPAEILRYYVVLLPSFIPTVLPISLMISILFSLGQLHRDNEIIALRSCGLSLFRITRTLWLVGAVLSGAMFYLNAHLVPWSVEQSRIIRDNYEFSSELQEKSQKDIGLIYNLTFNNMRDNRLWFINRFSEYTNEGYGITVSILGKDRSELSRLVANEGYFDEVDLNWVFIRGREIRFDPESGSQIYSMAFDKKVVPEFQEEPRLMKYLEKRPKDLSLWELTGILNRVTAQDVPKVTTYEIRYFAIYANTLSCFIIVGLAVPFAVAGVRTNPLVGITKSFGLFFLFYIVSQLVFLVGERQILDPRTAAWLPSVLMVLLGLYLYRKAV